ncbi:unnamed protein product [Prorocentrum cordatum]|uniref:F-box domain-containing protein n=1 Tax=Prorocentrum cordatum TaxID=2364126 RepID=A0ABN9XDK3_9DINO|nr:unnamed protein product [Polarella glacialis]
MGSLARLPPEALQRCLLHLRATELAPSLGACSRVLRRACQQPELWRRELEVRFPDGAGAALADGAAADGGSQRGGSFRGALVAELRAHHAGERGRQAGEARRCQEAVFSLQAPVFCALPVQEIVVAVAGDGFQCRRLAPGIGTSLLFEPLMPA